MAEGPPILFVILAKANPDGLFFEAVPITRSYETKRHGPRCCACGASFGGKPALSLWRQRGLPHRIDFCSACAASHSDDEIAARAAQIMASLPAERAGLGAADATPRVGRR